VTVAQLRLIEAPLSGLWPISVPEANRLLLSWGHRLGPCLRPFRTEAFSLELDGQPIAVALSASIVNGPVAGFRRDEVPAGR